MACRIKAVHDVEQAFGVASRRGENPLHGAGQQFLHGGRAPEHGAAILAVTEHLDHPIHICRKQRHARRGNVVGCTEIIP